MNTHTYGDASGLANQGTLDKALTPAGRDWLTFALDPFHDTPTRIAGLPDADTSSTVVQLLKKTLSISAPPGTVGNWSFNCFTSNLMYKAQMAAAQRIKGNFNQTQVIDVVGVPSIANAHCVGDINEVPADNPDTDVGTINVWSWADDRGTIQKPFFPNGLAGQRFTKPARTQYLDCQPNTLQNAASKTRVIGMGFELHNTTAELYKQGTLTISRAPSNSRTTSIRAFRDVDGNLLNPRMLSNTIYPKWNTMYNPGLTRKHVAPPQSLEDALSYVGSIQHEAAEGAYVTCTMNTDECRLQYGSVMNHEIGGCQLYADPDAPVTPETCYATDPDLWYFPQFTTYYNTAAYNSEHPFAVSSVMATGLSPQTTFTLEFKVLVEIAPHLNDPVYGPLAWSATPSADWDKRALALYQAAATVLPVGVKVSENADGDFWNTVRGIVRDVAPFVTEGISMLLPGFAGKAVTGVVNAVGSRLLQDAPTATARSTLQKQNRLKKSAPLKQPKKAVKAPKKRK